MFAEKNRHIRFAKIAVPPLITLVGSMTNGTFMQGQQNEVQVFQTAGACDGFGFKKDRTFYVNEGIRCGSWKKQSRASILVYLALHYCDLDSNGFCMYGNTREIASLAGITMRTVRNSLRKLVQAEYITAGVIGRNGDFTFQIPDYKDIGLTYAEGGRGYLNLEEGMFCQMASMRDVNALRIALRMAITVDNPRSAGEVVVQESRLRSSLPKYMTKKMMQESMGRVRESCPFLEIGEEDNKGYFMLRQPQGKDVRTMHAAADLENLDILDGYIMQLSSLYEKQYDEAESYHHKYGKYPAQFNVMPHEREHLDRELIFKTNREQATQYASMATQYGIGIVKQALSYIAREVSIFRRQIESIPAYLRQLIRRHPDGVFGDAGACGYDMVDVWNGCKTESVCQKSPTTAACISNKNEKKPQQPAVPKNHEGQGLHLQRFEDFVSAYPKSCINQIATKREYASLLASGNVTEDMLIQCAKNYAEACRIKETPDQYIKYAENFLKDSTFMFYAPDKYTRPESKRNAGKKNRFHNFDQPKTSYDDIVMKKLRAMLGNG